MVLEFYSNIIFKGLLVALGGYNGDELLKSIECYCTQKKAWEIGPAMIEVRSGHGAAISIDFSHK